MKVKHILGALLVVLFSYLSIKHSFTIASREAEAVEEKAPQQAFNLLSRIGGASGELKLNQPSYAVSDNQGRVYISDSGNQRIVVTDPKGRLITAIGTKDSLRPLVYPYGIVVMGNRLIVADSGRGSVEEYNTDGEHLKTWISPQENFRPGMLALNKDGMVIAGDLQGKQLLIFSRGGQLLSKLRPGKLALGVPHGLAATKEGSIWVADGENSSIKLLDSGGETISVLDSMAGLATPKGLALDSSGRMYISDVLSNSVWVLDKSGKELGRLQESRNEQFTLPLGISVDKSDRILVADQGGNNIQIWGQRR
ncbi:MAG TPA: NHL repeat-containing protein [Bacillota bacterium]|nr:NHL repeat-containing protein [Bacillota bacterium]